MNNVEWIQELDRLESFFITADLPVGTIKINDFETYHNLREAIDRELDRARKHVGNNWFSGAIQKLQEIERYIKDWSSS